MIYGLKNRTDDGSFFREVFGRLMVRLDLPNNRLNSIGSESEEDLLSLGRGRGGNFLVNFIRIVSTLCVTTYFSYFEFPICTLILTNLVISNSKWSTDYT